MSGRKSFRHGVAWAFAGRTSDQLLSFVFGVVLARMLAPEDFGLLLTIQVFTGLAGFVAGGGMGQALVQAKSTTQEDYDVVFTLQLGIGCLIYALFFLLAPWLANWYKQPIYVDLLRLSALSFIFRPLVNIPSSAIYRAMRYKALTGVNVLTLMASSATSIGLASLGHGVWSLVWGGIVGSIVQCLALMRLSGWRPGLSLDLARARDLARYGALVAGNDLLDYLRSRINIFLLSQTLGPQSVGLYNKGDSLARMPLMFVSGSVYQVLFREMAAEQDNLDRCRYLFLRSIVLVSVYGTPFYIGLLFLADPLVRGVYGSHWAAAAGPISILALAWPLWLLTNLSGAVAAAHSRLGPELQINAGMLVVTAGFVWLALPYGINGVAWSMVGAAACICALMLHLALRTLKASVLDVVRALLPAMGLNAALAAAMAGASYLLPAAFLKHDLLHVAAVAGLGGVTYAALFLSVRISALTAEQARWRRLLSAKRWRAPA